VICGIPVYHYDHIDEYHVVREHKAANITLLCGSHHDLKSRGQLPAQVVRAKDAQPWNRVRTETAPHSLFYFGHRAEIVAGGNRVVVSNHSVSAIKVDGHSLVDFELVDGNLMLNVDFRDSDGSPVLTVCRNELVHSTHLWDYEFTGRRLSIREGQGLMYISVAFETDRHRVVIDKGLVSHNGVEVLFDPRGLCILNNCSLLSGSSVTGLDAAISIGDDPERAGPVAIHIEIDRGSFDRDAAIAWARQKIKENAEQLAGHPLTATQGPATVTHPMGTHLTWMSVCGVPYLWAQMSCGRVRWP